jgi:hypothetical protein
VIFTANRRARKFSRKAPHFIPEVLIALMEISRRSEGDNF